MPEIYCHLVPEKTPTTYHSRKTAYADIPARGLRENAQSREAREKW